MSEKHGIPMTTHTLLSTEGLESGVGTGVWVGEIVPTEFRLNTPGELATSGRSP